MRAKVPPTKSVNVFARTMQSVDIFAKKKLLGFELSKVKISQSLTKLRRLSW